MASELDSVSADLTCYDTLSQGQAKCSALTNIFNVAGAIETYASCPAAQCFLLSGTCIAHMSTPCYIKDDMTDSCCPAEGVRQDNASLAARAYAWGNWQVQPDGSRKMLVRRNKVWIQIQSDTFSNPNSGVLWHEYPDQSTNLPFVMTRESLATTVLAVEEIPKKPIYLAIPDTGVYGESTACILGTSASVVRLLFYYDAPRGRWVSLPGQYSKDNFVNASVPPNIFYAKRHLFLVIKVVDADVVQAYRGGMQYTVPEYGFRGTATWVGGYRARECATPIPLDDRYARVMMQAGVAARGLKMLGSPVLKRWNEAELTSPLAVNEGGTGKVDITVPMPTVAADAWMTANQQQQHQQQQRRSSSSATQGVDFGVYYLDNATETWIPMANCSQYSDGTRIITCPLDASFVRQVRMQLTAAILASSTSYLAQAMQAAELMLDPPLQPPSTTPAPTMPVSTTTPAPTQPLSTTPVPADSSSSSSSVGIIAGSVVGGAAVVAAVAAIIYMQRRSSVPYQKLKDGSKAAIHEEGEPQLRLLLNIASDMPPELPVEGFFCIKRT